MRNYAEKCLHMKYDVQSLLTLPLKSPTFCPIRMARILSLLAAFFLLIARTAHCEPAPETSPSGVDISKQTVSCGKDLEITIPSTWVAVPVSFPAVQCAFKLDTFKSGASRIGAAKSDGFGFPNVNVVVEPAPRTESETSIDRKIQGILESYRSVGLQDVQVLGPLPVPTPSLQATPHQTTPHTAPFFAITVQYTGNQGTMLSSVAFFDIGDRRFTTTYLDRKGANEDYVKEAGEILRSVALSQESLALLSPLPDNHSAEITKAAFSPSGGLSLFLGGLLILGAIIALFRMRRQ